MHAQSPLRYRTRIRTLLPFRPSLLGGVSCVYNRVQRSRLNGQLPAPAVRRFQLAMSGAVPLPLPDLDGPPGRLGLSVTRPDLFPRLSDV